MVKKLENTNLNVIVRVALETDENDYKNSIMTFYRIRNKNLQKLMEKTNYFTKSNKYVTICVQ